MAIVEKLETLLDTKMVIKEAIISRGVNVSDTDSFASYADKIREIQGSDVEFVETGRIITIEE